MSLELSNIPAPHQRVVQFDFMKLFKKFLLWCFVGTVLFWVYTHPYEVGPSWIIPVEYVSGSCLFTAFGIGVWRVLYFFFSRAERDRQRQLLLQGIAVLGRIERVEEGRRQDLYLTYEISGKTIEKLLSREPVSQKSAPLVFVDPKDRENFLLYDVSWYKIKNH